MEVFRNSFTTAQKVAYIRRALELAANGRAYASPNPMVGAVLVAPDGRVIGEGWHRVCGRGHAEVNAVASVAECDRSLLSRATMFVTLEPCSHYGKTPPCARMIVERGIPHVVVAMMDPNPKVSGRGIGILREAGVEVEVGVLEDEARELNRKFLTAMLRKRPFITLKWARSADGFMDRKRDDRNTGACRFSTPLTAMTTMKLRAEHDAILTTSATVRADNPRLTLRGFEGRQPRPVVLVGSGGLPEKCNLTDGADASAPIVYSGDATADLPAVFADMYATHGLTSVLVEAGPTLLARLIELELWDAAREEIAPFCLGNSGVKPAPALPADLLEDERRPTDDSGRQNILRTYRNGMPKG